jgi:hypothetical protein
MSADWVKANEQYMRFQNMNPIFGEILLYRYTELSHGTCF